MNVDELTMLRELVVDEPIDDEAARAEVWRRLGGGEPAHTGARRRRLALVAAAIVVVGTASTLAAARESSGDPFTARGKLAREVAGVRFTFVVPAHKLPYYEPDFSWENGQIEKVDGGFRVHSQLISTGFYGGQVAEAVFFWTAFPDGGEAAPCGSLRNPAIGRTTADLAAAMARAPGTRLVRRPARATVGGRPATHLVLRVLKDRGCEPGYFFSWLLSERGHDCWGSCWLDASVGDTIRVWIVAVEGKRLIFQAETKYPGPPGPAGELARAYSAEFEQVDQDITKIVGSIRFE